MLREALGAKLPEAPTSSSMKSILTPGATTGSRSLNDVGYESPVHSRRGVQAREATVNPRRYLMKVFQVATLLAVATLPSVQGIAGPSPSRFGSNGQDLKAINAWAPTARPATTSRSEKASSKVSRHSEVPGCSYRARWRAGGCNSGTRYMQQRNIVSAAAALCAIGSNVRAASSSSTCVGREKSRVQTVGSKQSAVANSPFATGSQPHGVAAWPKSTSTAGFVYTVNLRARGVRAESLRC